MSELTLCNHCSLNIIRQQAKKQNKIITLRNADGGIYVHSHRADEALDTIEWDKGNKQIVAWFMELSDSCVC